MLMCINQLMCLVNFTFLKMFFFVLIWQVLMIGGENFTVIGTPLLA